VGRRCALDGTSELEKEKGEEELVEEQKA